MRAIKYTYSKVLNGAVGRFPDAGLALFEPGSVNHLFRSFAAPDLFHAKQGVLFEHSDTSYCVPVASAGTQPNVCRASPQCLSIATSYLGVGVSFFISSTLSQKVISAFLSQGALHPHFLKAFNVPCCVIGSLPFGEPSFFPSTLSHKFQPVYP